jgi:hypothetical protein
MGHQGKPQQAASILQPSDYSNHLPIYWYGLQTHLQVHIDGLTAMK